MRLARALPGAPHFSRRSPPPGRSKKAIPPDLLQLCEAELGGQLPIFTRSGAFCHDNAIAAAALDPPVDGSAFLWYILIVGLCDACDAGFFDGEASATGRCVTRTLRYHLLAGLPDALPLATSANEFAFGACRQHEPDKHCCQVTGVTAQKAQCVTDGGPRDPLPASTTAAG